MSDVCDVLGPLAVATELLTTETQPAAGRMYYLLNELVSIDLAVCERPGSAGTTDDDWSDTEMEESDDYDSPVAAKLKAHISKCLRERFGLTPDGEPEMEVCKTCPMMISAFCDPR